MVGHPQPVQQAVQDGTGDAGRCIDFFAENQGHLVAEDVPQHAAKYSAYRAHQYRYYGRKPSGQGFLQSQDGEQPDADGVEEEKGTAQPEQGCLEEIRGGHGHADGEEVVQVFHPTNGRVSNEDVPDGAASDRRHQRNNGGTEKVKFLVGSRCSATDGKYKGAEQVEQVDGIHGRFVRLAQVWDLGLGAKVGYFLVRVCFFVLIPPEAPRP